MEDAVFVCETFETRYQTKMAKRIIHIVDASPVSFDKLIYSPELCKQSLTHIRHWPKSGMEGTMILYLPSNRFQSAMIKVTLATFRGEPCT